MIKKIILIMVFVLSLISLVYSATTQVYFSSKFVKEDTNIVKSHSGWPIHNYTKKQYFGARPIYELEKERSYEDFRDEYVIWRRESRSFRKPVVVDFSLYDFRRKTEYDDLVWERVEFKERNKEKINLYNQYGLRYRDSNDYRNNYER